MCGFITTWSSSTYWARGYRHDCETANSSNVCDILLGKNCFAPFPSSVETKCVLHYFASYWELILRIYVTKALFSVVYTNILFKLRHHKPPDVMSLGIKIILTMWDQIVLFINSVGFGLLQYRHFLKLWVR